MAKIKATTVDLSEGMIDLLKEKEPLILKGKEKRIEIGKDSVQVFEQRQRLEKEQLPSKIGGLEVTDLQKGLLLKGKEISVGDASVKLNEERTGLDVSRADGKRGLKIG